MGTTDNSSATVGTSGLGRCTCCHTFGQVTPHWDHPRAQLCEACRHILFVLEAHGSISHTAYAFHLRIQAGDL